MCNCDCGNTNIIIRRGCLKNGHTQSCGCLQKEKISEAKKKYNKYDLSGTYGIGYTTNTNKEFYFDLDDYEKIKEFAWLESDSGYIITAINKKNTRQHRLIMDVLNNDVIIDHINTFKYDNRKSNLRFADKQTNGRNRGVNKNNKLGIKGIYEKNGKYYPKITINYKTICLGTYYSLEEAINVYEENAKKFFGEFYYSGGDVTE